MDEPTLARLRALAIGSPCVRVEYAPWLTILLREAGGFDIYSCWRLVHDGQIVAGHAPPERAKPLATGLIVGQPVTVIQVPGDYNELHLTFANGAQLETFSESPEYEHWQYSSGPDMIIAGPGKLWSSF